jgi:hypothetical protein
MIATLSTVLCYVKIQNDCSKYFKTRLGLRQGDVLSTLIFNIVLKSIVRRAKLQTNGTVFKKQTQGRSQAAGREAFAELKKEANKEGLISTKVRLKSMILDVRQSVTFGYKTF